MTDIEKILTKMAETKERAAEHVIEWTIGRHALELIGSEEGLTASTLTASLEREINSSDSANGKCSPEQDLKRLAAEKALVAISIEQAS